MNPKENSLNEIVSKLLKTFATTLSKPQYVHFEQIIKGILFSKHKSINSYSKSSIRNQSSLNRFMNSNAVNEEQIRQVLKGLIASKLDFSKEINLVLDDTIKHHKYGKHIFGLGNHHDHLNGGYSVGQNIVTCGIYQNMKFYPTNYEIYRQAEGCETSAFKTKIEIAQAMLEEWIDKVNNVLLDSWYASQDILKYICQKGKSFFTMMKKDRLFKSNHKVKRQLQEWNKYLDPKKYQIIRIGNQTLAVQEKIGYLPKVGKVKILFTKFYDPITKKSKDLHYVCTNNYNLSMEEILLKYKDRWPIETFYRDNKQLLGLEKSIIRKEIGTKRHLLMSFIAHNILVFSKKKQMSCGEIQNELKYSYIENVLKNYGLKTYNLEACKKELMILC